MDIEHIDHDLNVREVDTWQELADLIGSSQLRTFERSARRADADEEENFTRLREGDDQEFTFSAVTDGNPSHYTARLKVATSNGEGSLVVDIGLNYQWSEPVSFSDELEVGFVKNVVFPELYAYARVFLAQSAREIGIRSATISPRPDFQREGVPENHS